MNEKVCDVETIGRGLEGIWNRLFHLDLTVLGDAGAWLCQVADANIISAICIAILLPFIEAFIPALPYTAFVIFNVSLLGGVLGFILSLVGTVMGSWLLFVAVRFLFQKRVLQFLKKHNQLRFYNKIVNGVERHGILYMFVLYGVLGLILPSSLCTISLGLTECSKRKFFIGLLSGKALITGLLALFGKSITQVFENPLLFIVVLVIGGIIYIASKRLSTYFEF